MRTIPKRHGIANIDLVRTYMGLILTGKSDFEAVDLVRNDPFFKETMGIIAKSIRLAFASTLR